MKIAIIGGGFTGLTAALRLSQKKHQVFLFEKEDHLGGLASGFKEKDWDSSLENIYHHIFTSDKKAISLIKELYLYQKLKFKSVKSSLFLENKTERFDSPLSILKFSRLSLPQRIRVGIASFFLKLIPQLKLFEEKKAYLLLPSLYGKKAYKTIWQPLLASKFGNNYKKISMLWFWARIKKRSFKLGFLNGGFEILIKALKKEIIKNNGKIILKKEIKDIDSLKAQEFEKIIFTIPTPAFEKIIKDHSEYKKKLLETEWLGFLNLILILKQQFLTDNTYWLNINEKGFPFVAIVEHTNAMPSKDFGNQQILYIGGYYDHKNAIFKKNEKQILKEFLPFLKKINGNYSFDKNIIKVKKYSSLFSQPVIPTNYSKQILKYKTPINNVYLANMSQIFPWDRGINYAIKEGEKVGFIAIKD